MKKILLIILMLLCLSLSGCDIIGNINDGELNADEFTAKLMVTRNAIQKQNIVVKTTIELGLMKGTVISEGSGVVIDRDENYYYILTNRHVVEYTESTYKSLTVEMTTFYNDTFSPIRMPMTTDYDLALFKTPRGYFKTAIEPIDITKRLMKELQPGEMVLAVGNPGSTTFNVTFGTLQNRKVTLSDVSYPVLQHSAIIFKGNSGGALTDTDGNLIGINTWGNESTMDMGFAIGLEQINDFLDLFEPTQPTT